MKLGRKGKAAVEGAAGGAVIAADTAVAAEEVGVADAAVTGVADAAAIAVIAAVTDATARFFSVYSL
jgi:hypothetical protein